MSGFTTGMKSSLTDEWATPRYVFDELDKEFGFDLDGTDALDFPDVRDTIRRIQSLIDDHRGGGEE